MKQTTLEKIKNAVKALEEKGAPFTQGDLAKEAECSSLTVCYAIKEGHLHFVPVGEQRDNYLLKELRKGKPLFEIARRVNYGLNMMHTRLHDLGPDLDDLQMPADLPKEETYRVMKGLMRDENEDISNVARYVVRGLTLEEIGQKFGETRESARQKIEALGLHDFWQDRRERKPLVSKHLQEARKLILGVLEKRIEILLEGMPWAERKAYEYNLNSQLGFSDRAIPHERLMKLFSTYRSIKEDGEIIPLKDIYTSLGYYHPEHIRYIFRRMGLAPLHAKRHHKLSKDKIKALEKAVNLGYLSNRDIVYFARLSGSPIYNRFKRKNRNRAIKFFSHGRKLRHMLASQIYQAADLGFSAEEAVVVCDTKSEVVSYALEHRREIEPRIVRGIQAIYPDVPVSKPYIDFDPEEHRYKVLKREN